MMRASEKTRVLQKIAFQQGVRIFHSSPYSFSGHFELGIGQCLIFREDYKSLMRFYSYFNCKSILENNQQLQKLIERYQIS